MPAGEDPCRRKCWPCNRSLVVERSYARVPHERKEKIRRIIGESKQETSRAIGDGTSAREQIIHFKEVSVRWFQDPKPFMES